MHRIYFCCTAGIFCCTAKKGTGDVTAEQAEALMPSARTFHGAFGYQYLDKAERVIRIAGTYVAAGPV
jgi:hypothetical protein